MFLSTLILACAPCGAVNTEAPFLPSDRPAEAGVSNLRLDLEVINRSDEAVWAGLPLPGGDVVDLALERGSWRSLVDKLTVDGIDRPDINADLDLTVWKGHVLGREETSTVRLGASTHGVHGSVELDGQIWLLRGRPNAAGEWLDGHFVVERLQRPAGPSTWGVDSCGTEDDRPKVFRPRSESDAPEKSGFAAAGAYHIRQAISVDYWVYAAFNDVSAEVAYLYELMWSVSEFFRADQGNVLLTFPSFHIWTQSNDMWDACDLGIDNKGDVLDEFEDKWGGIFQAEQVHLAMLLCGKTIGGGKASGIGGICPGLFSSLGEHAVAGSINGNQPLPVPSQSPSNWEFIVIAHEIGHNLGAVHTHDNGIDDCDDDDPSTPCPVGTIMSYCHTCTIAPGAMANIKVELHPQTKADITSCLDSEGCFSTICGTDVYVSMTPGFPGIPNGSSFQPFSSLLEAAAVAGLCGNSPAIVYVDGGFPGSLEINETILLGQSVEFRLWPGKAGATIGQ